MMLRKCKSICAFLIIASLLVTSFFLFPQKVYALNENIVAGEYNGWIERDVDYKYETDKYPFTGNLKCIFDEDNGCCYIFFNVYDKRILNGSDETMVISFTVRNTANEYKFSVNKNGFINTEEDDMNAVNIAYNFENASAHGGGGQIFVGFELKNKFDREQFNYIKCEYGAGVDRVTTLFDNKLLDMYVEPTVSTTKKTTTKKSVKEKTSKQTTVKSSRSDDKTTKFKGSGTVKHTNTTKYNRNDDASQNFYSKSYDTDSVSSTGENISDSYEDPAIPANVPTTMSKSAIAMIVIACIIATAGLVLLIIAAVAKTEKPKSNPFPENLPNPTEEDE